jgi:hypothetical protein
MFGLELVIASYLASATGAAVSIAAVSSALSFAFTAATIAYSVTSSRRAARRQQEAYRNSLQDRTVTIRASDAPRDIVYGRVRKGGVVAYVVPATDTQRYFAMVLLLAGHECDGLEGVYVGDERYAWDPVSGELKAPTGTQLRYSRYDVTDANRQFVVNAARQINVGSGVQCLGVSSGDGRDELGAQVFADVGFDAEYDNTALAWTGLVTIPSAQPGQTVYVLLRERRWKQWIRVKFYTGTPDQAADPELMAISPNGEWTANHRLRGICYAVVFIDPDPEAFSDGLPEFSFVLRGRKVRLANGTTAWSRNPAECVRDYLTTYARWPLSAISDAEFQAAATACAEQVERGAPGSATIARYTCDGVLAQDETTHRDHAKTLLGAMLGTMVPVNAQAAIRAAAWSAPTVTLTDDDLIGPASVTAYQPTDRAFNAVRGRFFDGEELDVPAGTGRTFQRVNFAPYYSPVYIAQDGGRTEFDDVELPMTVDSVRAQRLAKLHLNRSRQALRITATWKLSALALSPGKTVRLKISRYGWADLDGGLGKAFRVDEMSVDFEGMKVTATMQEEAQAVFDWNYTEASGVDPAPNTSFPTWREITAPTGLRIDSGGAYIKQRGDGTRDPFARVTWDQSTEPSVLSGGWIEVEWLFNDATEWTRSGRIDPYTTAFHIPNAVANDLLRVRIRACNLIACSLYAYSTAQINPLAGPGTSSLGVGTGVNAVPGAKFRSTLENFDVYYVPTGATLPLTTLGGSLQNGADRLFLTYQGLATFGYGVIGVAEISVGKPTGQRAILRSIEMIPVSPGDTWELQAWVAAFGFDPIVPALQYHDANGAFIGASWGAGALPLVSSQDVFSVRRLPGVQGRIYRQCYAYVVIPPGAASARWALPLVAYTGVPNLPEYDDPIAFVAMPFAARCSITSAASLRANPLTYLSNWNG